MVDLAAKSGLSIDVNKLSSILDVPVVLINAREGHGLDKLKKSLAEPLSASAARIFPIAPEIIPAVNIIRAEFKLTSDYAAYLYLQQADALKFLSVRQKEFIRQLAKQYDAFPGKYQGAETIHRYGFIQDILNKIILRLPNPEWKKSSYRLDRVFTHKIWGYVIFFGVLFLIFQSIFAWAQVPMDWIDRSFAYLSTYLSNKLPEGPLFELIAKGIVPGIGGIVIFIPQIAMLFAFISILEETGYMARVVFLMDKLMSKVGLSGKSVVPLMSGWACAIPAIMATRTIENAKDRLVTILVAPLMSCSARLPVYLLMIATLLPSEAVPASTKANPNKQS